MTSDAWVQKDLITYRSRKLFLGIRRTLTLSDMWRVMDEHSAEVNYAHFDKEWSKELEKSIKEPDSDMWEERSNHN